MEQQPTIVFEPSFADVGIPVRATAGSAGYDARAHVSGRRIRVTSAPGTVFERVLSSGDRQLVLEARETALVPLGFKARLPAGYEAQIRLRSSVAFKKGLVLPNAPGTIDSDYPDEWLVMLRNDSGGAVTIEHGERIAQIVLARYAVIEWVTGTVGVTTERRGGVGSTG